MGLAEGFIIVFILAANVFWIWTVLDCANHMPGGTRKTKWLLIILIHNVVGSLTYFVIERPKRLKERKLKAGTAA